MPVLPTSMRRSTLVALLATLVALAFPGVAPAKVLGKPTWLSKVVVTEYFPAPEWWFVGAPVKAPGLARKSKIDWLYSARGVSMEGDGIGMDGRKYHIASIGSSGWITERGRRAQFGRGGIFAPFWRAAGLLEEQQRRRDVPARRRRLVRRRGQALRRARRHHLRRRARRGRCAPTAASPSTRT